MALRDGDPIWFYELHEGEDEVFSDLLLVHDAEYDEQEFLELVEEARAAVLERFEEDTLSEAIARELERRHGFLLVDDSRLRVAVNVGAREGETYVAAVEERASPAGDAEGDYRSVLVDIDREDRRWRDDG